MKNLARVLSSVSVFSVLAMASATAQTTAAKTAAATSVEEVTVTAQRRSENLQQVPVAVTAFTPRTLDDRQITNVRDAAAQIPGIMIQTTTGVSNAARIFLRGVGQDNAGLLFDPAVGVYVDGVYYARIMGAFFDFFDLDRVEVLRGPQGTLYGRNTSGGAIKIETKKPTYDLSAAGDIAYGSFNRIDVRGYISGPIVDHTLAASLSVLTRERDGTMSDPYYDRKINNRDYQAVRGKLLFTPNDKFEVVAGIDYIHDRSDAFVPTPISNFGTAVDPLATPNRDLFTSELKGVQFQKLDTYGITVNAKYDLNPITLSSITGYRFLRNPLAVPVIYVGGSALAGTGITSGTSFDVHDETISQEFNAAFESTKLKGVAGIYYFSEDGRDFEYLYGTNNQRFRKNEAYAAYAQGSYDVLEHVSLIGGLRYTDEKVNYQQWYFAIQNTPQAPLAKEFYALTPKIGAEWQFMDQGQAYFTWTKGFKSGGFSAIAPSALFPNSRPYNPEKVDSYEVGVKFQGFDNRLRANVALFRAEYAGLQLPVFLPGTISSYTSNAAGAQVQGIEFEPTWYVTPELQLYGNLAVTTSKYTSAFPGFNPFNQLVDLSDRKLKGTIPTKYLIGATYDPALKIKGNVRLNASLSHTDTYPNNTNNSPLVYTTATDLVDLSVSYTTDDGHWTVTAEGKNVTDKRYYGSALQVGNAVSPGTVAYPNDPATWALRVKYQY